MNSVATRGQVSRLDTAIHQRDRQKRFLAAFGACGSIERSCRSARVHRQTHYYWMRTDPTYPERFRQAEVRAARALEDEAVRRARIGIRKPVLHKGKQVYVQGEPLYTTEYSDSLLMFLLKAYNPEKFRDRMEQTNLLDITVEMLTCEQLDALAEHLIRKERGNLSPTEMANVKAEIRAAGESGETVEATFERADGEEKPGNGESEGS